MRRRGQETVQVLRRPVLAFPTMGDTSETMTSVPVSGCLIYPNTVTETVSRKAGTETIVGQDTVVSGLTCLMPFGTDVLPTDRVQVRGVIYDVNGQPSTWKSPSTGHRSVVEVQLKTATG